MQWEGYVSWFTWNPSISWNPPDFERPIARNGNAYVFIDYSGYPIFYDDKIPWFFQDTVKPVIWDHPFCHRKVVLHDRWSLSRGTHPVVFSVTNQNCLVLYLLMVYILSQFLPILRYFTMSVNHIKMFDLNSKDIAFGFLLFSTRQYSCAKIFNLHVKVVFIDR